MTSHAERGFHRPSANAAEFRVLVAPNSFKESLSGPEAAKAIVRGLERAVVACEFRTKFQFETEELPLADGGDGTAVALIAARKGHSVNVTVLDPLNRLISASYGVFEDASGTPTAIIEMACASGLCLLKPEEQDPVRTSTYGTGQLIKDALDRGVQSLLIGIGGSATTDGGLGMAAALGARVYDHDGVIIEKPTGGDLLRVGKIDTANLDPRLLSCKIVCACDVSNPLLGPTGAAAVFSPQKGARTPEAVSALERGLANVAACWARDLHSDPMIPDMPGSGAAGGLGAALRVFCNAQLSPGFDIIADAAGLDAAIRRSHLVISGEGRIDASTQFGKVPLGVALRARCHNVPVILLAGSVGGSPAELQPLYDAGVTAMFAIANGPLSLSDALANASSLLAGTAEQVFRLWLASNTKRL